mgnify:CR=1 FL=1|jgi:diguanylate cyclase (GGDEF)-like protein
MFRYQLLLLTDSPAIEKAIFTKLFPHFSIHTTTTSKNIPATTIDCIVISYKSDDQNITIAQKSKQSKTLQHIPTIIVKHPISANDIKNNPAEDCIDITIPAAELVARVTNCIQKTMWHQNLNPLTKLPGNMIIVEKIKKSLRQKGGVLFIDINNFKIFNNTYGFVKGDAVILETADLLKKECSLTDFLGHIGGDDFVIITDLENVYALKKSILDKFSLTIHKKYQVTATITVATHEKLQTVEQLCKCAAQLKQFGKG